ncbi:hypothetical protein [Methylotuvimicrobium buryatense]|uniref:PBP domain-containing protein n=1 Tax=Methylotuvimicrobium buryatense TaxID=95641 RepID=A0A4P9UKS0_METBY|nr:hypothetical protein [Methylotuvimicrobium buryatense]QCW81748.1 hypothetical protein EQU24_05410 [Methylotuvimicrobium buryatense]
MKKHALTAALAALSLTGFSGAAQAWTPSDTPDLELFMSGATAMDNAMTSMFNNICQDTDYYTDPNNGAGYRAFFCTLTPANVPGLSAPKKVLFIKRSAGGSAQGVNPLAEESQLDALNIFNNNCTEDTAGGKKWTCTINNPGDLTPKHPNIGISDVDPFMFRGRNTPKGFKPMTQRSIQALEVRAVAALIFGVPVTNGLYDALQTVQIDRGELPGSCSKGEYTEECMPSLSKQQVASLITGQIKSWDEFIVTKDGVDHPLTQYPGVTPPQSDLMHYCKRVDGSGTGAQQYAKFLHHPCTRCAMEPMVSDPVISDDNPFEGPRVFENSGSGNMDRCLDDFGKGTNTSGLNSNINGQAVTAWAIGQQSLEKNANNAFAYKFIKIDGYAPTLKNAANGTYMDWVEPTFQWRKTGAGSPSGDTLAIIEKIVVDAANPTTVASVLNQTSSYTFGKSGYLAVASNGHPFSHIVDENAPVIGYSHAAGGLLDNCNVPVLLKIDSDKPL